MTLYGLFLTSYNIREDTFIFYAACPEYSTTYFKRISYPKKYISNVCILVLPISRHHELIPNTTHHLKRNAVSKQKEQYHVSTEYTLP